MTAIVGAGLSGLIAACAFPSAPIFEAAPQGRSTEHKALLRFRSEKVAHLTGIDFRRVRVHKGIVVDTEFLQPNIQLANLYAAKVLRRAPIGDRSIWNLDPADRWIAPPDFYERLVDRVGHRIQWGTPIDLTQAQGWKISTIPMDIACQQAGLGRDIEFNRAEIYVERWLIPGCDVYQTVYFPDPTEEIYRASMTGDTLIIECIQKPQDDRILERCLQVFGLWNKALQIKKLDQAHQRYGKIAPIEDHARRAIIWELTHQHKVMSLGRFATWRNILLDDVVDDIRIVRQLMAASPYERKLRSV